jgi:rhamnogalacturonyl hydrolase YesR
VLDNFSQGYAILFLYEQTHQEMFKIAATNIRKKFNDDPQISNGFLA